MEKEDPTTQIVSTEPTTEQKIKDLETTLTNVKFDSEDKDVLRDIFNNVADKDE